MRVLLDTCVLIFALECPEKLSKPGAAIVRNAGNVLELSTVSLVEIAIKSSSGKLELSVETTRRAIEDLSIHVLPYSAQHAFRLFSLPLHHRDPFDRQLISQALSEDLAVVTPDQAFRLYPGVNVIW